jgi:hypothetical protein
MCSSDPVGHAVALLGFSMNGNGNSVSLDLEISALEDDPNPLDYGVFERLPGNRSLQFDGTAQGTATASGISTTLSGTVRFVPSATTSSSVTCKASDHQLLFTRGSATASRKKR